MKVRCVRLVDIKGRVQETSPWLTLGKVYHVLEIILGAVQKCHLRLIADGRNRTALFPMDDFEIVSPIVPTSWIVTWNKGALKFAPNAWTKAGFWERFYDGEPAEIQIFDEEVIKIIQSDT